MSNSTIHPLFIDSWSVKHVSDAHEDQNVLSDSNGSGGATVKNNST